MTEKHPIREGQIITGSLFNEPMRVETVRPNGPDSWVAGLVGTQSERFRKVSLTSRDLDNLTILDARPTFRGEWNATAEKMQHTFGGQALPIVWDFAEVGPLADCPGNWQTGYDLVAEVIEAYPRSLLVGQCEIADACAHPLGDESADVWFTDPPYYDAVPYSDLSDFFFVWLKRALPGNAYLRDPFDSCNPLTPKTGELVQDETKKIRDRPKDRDFFEERITQAFVEGRRLLRQNGVGCVVFAHKTTEGWEALLSGIIQSRWTITSSWPIATELGSRLRARESAALATSVHLICRPRPKNAPTGDWADVLREVPRRVGDWMERLQAEGVRGAARFLWTLQSTTGDVILNGDESEDEDVADDEEEVTALRTRSKSYTLVFDVVRRFAQPLGISLPRWEGRIIDTKKGVVRLLPVAERAELLFGEDGAQAMADRLGEAPTDGSLQLTLFSKRGTETGLKSSGRRRDHRRVTVADEVLEVGREATILDRVHMAMLLQADGRASALRVLLKTEQDRGPDFLRLANALSALYPKGSEEKRMLDAMLVAVPR
ncbi:hypothetical protein MYX78_01190 [Acidobacteria bacterium AH-259-G07]|nr:hypothetical protein [Acidobacteria bacterium AH-259-G07]